MSNAIDRFFDSMSGLPDPDLDRQFYAGVPARRLTAWIIDVMIAVAISLVVMPVLAILTLGLALFMIPLIYGAISFGYRVLTLAGGSATWGMRLTGIELRRGDGSRFDLGYAVAHVALYTFCIWTLLQLASLVTVLVTRHQQTLPDIVLRTTAINAPED